MTQARIRTPGEDVRQVCLLGASLDTGNMGINALAESSVKCVLARWPDAQVTFLGSGREEGEHRLRLSGKEVILRSVPIRFCKNVLLPHHFLVLACNIILLRLLPFGSVRRSLMRRNSCLKLLAETDCFIDIAGGDSFSDIYGMRRLTLGFLTRLLPLMLKKDLILFPQTYGPFKRAVSRSMARYILKRARRIYSRDQAGLDYVKGLLGRAADDARLRFSPDVAFVLDPRKPKEGAELQTEPNEANPQSAIRNPQSVVVGLNVSGLLYYGGYTGGNEFGLKADYKQLIDRIVDLFVQKEDTCVLLVPHVIPTGRFKGNVENDLSASLDVYERLSGRYPGRLLVARGPYDHGETKYIIGQCDFFIGTRMHSCIAALSQYVPAVGLAYSKKFRGVFETVGVGDLALEMRYADVNELIAAVDKAFASRAATAARLHETVPSVQKQVLAMLR